MFKTLFSRMLTTYLAVILSILLLLGITVATMFRNQYTAEQEKELRREAEEINSILVDVYVYPEKRPVAAEELRIIARKYDGLIQVVDAENAKMSFMFAGSEDQWAVIDGVDISQLAVSIIDGTAGAAIITDLYQGMTDFPIMSYARPVINHEDKYEGAIFFHVNMSTVNESIRQVYLDIMLSSCIAVILAILVVSYITGRITKPVINMNRIVKRYSSGDFEMRIPLETSDEIGQLAASFNVMADELNNLEEARRNFVANVSHELRSPLTSMRGFLEAMQDGTIPEAEHSKYLNIVISENKRMSDMVNDLLDLARIESGQIIIKPEVFDINELIRRTLITFEARIGQKHLEVIVDLGGGACFVKADPSQIAQVLRNLIDNAIKFSPDSGTLTLGTHALRRQVSVMVADSGCGIDKSDLEHIFERFYKAEKAHTPKGGTGTGLGLSIAKRIIDQHQQTIRVQSAPEEGTTFIFTLQRVQEPTRSKKPHPPES